MSKQNEAREAVCPAICSYINSKNRHYRVGIVSAAQNGEAVGLKKGLGWIGWIQQDVTLRWGKSQLVQVILIEF